MVAEANLGLLIIVNGRKSLTIITKSSILGVAAVLNPTLSRETVSDH